MLIRILKWRYSNIRDFRDLEILLTAKPGGTDPYRVSFIQMPNGTGKTTSVSLLTSAICGRDIGPEEVKSYRPTMYEARSGFFELHLRIDNTVFAVRLHLDYETGNFRYTTTRPNIAGGGRSDGHTLPVAARSILTEAFTHLFVFNGELSKQLADKEFTKADEAIQSLYFLDQLGITLPLHIDRLVEARVAAVVASKARTDQGLRILRTRRDNFLQMKVKLEAEVVRFSASRAKHGGDLNRLNAEYEKLFAADKEVAVKRTEYKNNITRCENEISRLTHSLITHIRSPAQYSNRTRTELTDLASRMAVLKLPRTTSIEFFKELSESKECVCGEPMTPDRRTRVLENASKFLTEDETAVINAMKHSVRELGPYESAEPILRGLSEQRVALQEAVQLLARLEHAADTDTQARAQELRVKRDAAKDEFDEADLALTMIQTTDQGRQEEYELNEENNLPLCEKAIAEYTGRIAAATATIGLQARAGLLKRMIEDVRVSALKAIKKDLIRQSNARVAKLLGNEEIQITHIDGSLAIEGKEAVSTGQSLAVAYSFLATLFATSPYRVPFVIDSPAGPLDLDVRREASQLLPQLFDQLVVFIISSERRGFIEEISKQKSVQYLTVFKDVTTPGKTVANPDPDFFLHFQSQEA